MFFRRGAVIGSCLLAGALALFFGTGALAAPEVTVHPTTLGLPLATGESVTQSLFLSAAQTGSLTVDSVTIEYITGRDDARLSSSAARIVDFASGASGTTIPIGLTLMRKEFSYPGSYKIGLRIRGRRSAADPAKPVAIDELIEVSVTRAAAQITVKIGNDARVTVERGTEQQISFAVVQDGGSDISDLKLVQGTVGRSSDSALAPGKIELDPPTLTIAGGTAAGTLKFSGFSDAGDYKTDLSFTSANLAKPVTVPIMIRVKVHWVWAFITIIAGVLGGTIVYVLVHVWRPRQLLAYRLAHLQGRLQALLIAIHETATQLEYYRLQGRIYNLTQGIDLDLTNDAAVQQLQTEVEAFEAKIAKVQADADQALKTLTEDLRQARNDLMPLGGNAERDLKAIQLQVDECRARYEEGHAEEAAGLIKAAADTLKDTRIRLANEAIATMQTEIAHLNEPPKSELTGKAQKIAADLGKPGAKIDEIIVALHALRNDINAAKGAKAIVQFAMAQAQGRPTISVDFPPGSRRAGTFLRFDLGGLRSAIANVTWSFDGLEQQSKDPWVNYRFPVPRNYFITAVVTYADGTSETAYPLWISILPSETQSLAQTISRKIRDVDLALLVVALILASVTGLLDRYVDKPFGTVADYCWAFLWGFGIDNVVRGFGATLGRIKT